MQTFQLYQMFISLKNNCRICQWTLSVVLFYQFIQSVWRQRIQYRFQNDRMRKDSCIQGKRRLSQETTAVPQKSKKVIWGLQNYLGERPAGEDDISILRHQEAMHDERKPEQSRLARLLDLTFADRRDFIMKRNPTVADIREQYPALFHSEIEVIKMVLALLELEFTFG